MKMLMIVFFAMISQPSFADCSTGQMKSRVKLLSGTAVRMYSSSRSFLAFVSNQEISSEARKRYETEYVADRPTMLVVAYDTDVQVRVAVYPKGGSYENATDFTCQPGLCSISVMPGTYNFVIGNKSDKDACILAEIFQRRL